MANEISSVSPVAPVAAVAAVAPTASASANASAAAANVLQLLQPVEDLLQPGQSAVAQVLDVQQNADSTYQVLLKLSPAYGLVSTLQATSSQPLTAGSSLTVTQLTAGTLAVTLQQIASDNITTLTSIDTAEVPEGSLIQGKVLSSTLLPQSAGQPAVYRSLVSLVNSALAGATLSIDSPKPLTPGSLLSAQVQDNQSLKFVPLSGRLDQLVVGQQLQSQQNRQASLQGLLSALQNLPVAEQAASASAPGDDSLAADLRASVASLLAGLPDMDQMSNPKTVAQALNDSGVFLEAKLLAGATPALSQDLKANLLRLVATLLPQVPSSSVATSSAANAIAQAMPFVRSALGILEQAGNRPLPGGFPLPPRNLQGGEAGDLDHLLKLSVAALSRLQSHQLTGLEQTRTHADGLQQTTWQLEVPMRNLNDIVPLQVRLQRDEKPYEQTPDERGRPREQRDGTDLKELLWRVELAFDMAPLGPLQVQAQLLRGNISSQLWAEKASTVKLIQGELGHLRDKLVAQGLQVDELACHLGVPPQGKKTRIEQRWVDENA